MGAKPVFADIDPKTYNIDPKEIERKITDKTKAIIPVHFTGQPCDMDGILKIAEKYDLVVIEDGAHALGAIYKNRKIGSIGSMTTFSFHPVKHITTGEGGAVTTNDRSLYEKLHLFRTHGITREVDMMESNEGPWFYEQQELGYNYRMTDIQAALGASQMKKLESFLGKRRSYAALYNRLLGGFEGVTIPYQAEDVSSAWHLYVIKLNLSKLALGRREVFEKLRDRNIGVNVHHIPVYYHPYYKRLGYEKGLCPVAEALYEAIITLPLYPTMETDDIRYIVDNLMDILR
jgi:dTDP-4-amino-4,6-dideoxygalactose transaminase